MKSIITVTTLLQIVFSSYTDCDYYTGTISCMDDDDCYMVQGNCHANCSVVMFKVGVFPQCEVNGCTPIIDESFAEGEQPCSFTDTTTTTKSPTRNPITIPLQSTPTPTVPINNGRCASDGSIQQQRFGPSSYSCGDHNLGQPEERCIYIDILSTCTGTQFGECGTETNAWPTFQSALDSLNGETVVLIVKPGTYYGNGNINITSPNINNLNEYVYLNIFSESGSDETIIDCQGKGFGFHLYQTTIRMDGFTVTNCIAPNRPSFQLPSYATNLYINSGLNTGRLGGAFFLDRTFITMNDMIIISNEAQFGGAIFQYQNSIRMNNSIIEYNCATNSGGGIFLLFSNIYISNSYVLCNSAEIFGGGIFGHQQRTDILDYTLIDDNSAQYANEIFCDQTTVNVDSDNNAFISDNNVLGWNDNEITYCCCNNCAFYNLDRSIDFCSKSDNSKVDIYRRIATIDSLMCPVPIPTTTTIGTGGTTGVGGTTGTTSTQSSGKQGYNLILGMVVICVSFMILM
eukprot:295970_1